MYAVYIVNIKKGVFKRVITDFLSLFLFVCLGFCSRAKERQLVLIFFLCRARNQDLCPGIIREGADRVRGRGRWGGGRGRRGGGRREKRGGRREKRGREEGEEGVGGGRGEEKREGGEKRKIWRARSARRSRREEGDKGAGGGGKGREGEVRGGRGRGLPPCPPPHQSVPLNRD